MFSYVNEHVKIYFQFSKRSFSHCVCVLPFSGFFYYVYKEKKRFAYKSDLLQIRAMKLQEKLFLSILEGPSPPFNVRNPEKYDYKNYCYDSLYDSFN